MTNFSNCFILHYSTLTAPLRNLTQKDTLFNLDSHHQETFNTLKSLLRNATTMSFYKPLATTQMITDACSVGLGANITQLKENGDYKLVAYSSWSLIDVELWYSQTQKLVMPTFTLLYIWPTCYNHNWSWTFGEVAFELHQTPLHKSKVVSEITIIQLHSARSTGKLKCSRWFIQKSQSNKFILKWKYCRAAH